MHTGIILNSFTCFLISLFSLWVCWKIWRHIKYERRLLWLFLFWIVFALVWLSFGLSGLWTVAGKPHLTEIFAYINQVFAILTLPAIAVYIILSLKSHAKTSAYLVGCAYLLLAALFYFFLFNNGFAEGIANYFESGYYIQPENKLIFMAGFAPLLLLVIINLAKIFSHQEKNKKHILILSSLLIIGLAGSIDQLDLLVGWPALISRFFLIIAVLMTYLAF